MAVLSKGTTFADGTQVTSTNLNNHVDNATFASGAVDDSTTQLSSGAIIVKDGGITPAKLSTGAPSWDGSSNLTVSGNVTLSDSDSSGGLIINNTATDGDPTLSFQLSGTSKFTIGVDDGDSDKLKIGTTAIGTNTSLTIDASQNVGIGQSSPSAQLDVNSGVVNEVARFVSTDTTAYIGIADDTGSAHLITSGSGNLRITTGGADENTVGTEALRVDGSQNVGIGETSPSAKLHVTGGSGTLPALSTDTFLVVEGTDGNAEISILADSTSGKSIINLGDEADEDVCYIQYDHSTDIFTINRGGGSEELTLSTLSATSGGAPASSNSFEIDGYFVMSGQTAPSSASANGKAGTVVWDANYIYVCTATDTWKRASLATW